MWSSETEIKNQNKFYVHLCLSQVAIIVIGVASLTTAELPLPIVQIK